MLGIVYSETVVWVPPAAYVDKAPYQLAIVDTEAGERVSVRIQDDRVSIGDRVEYVETREGVSIYRKIKG
jgi:uncharacterized OB-fold protein